MLPRHTGRSTPVVDHAVHPWRRPCARSAKSIEPMRDVVVGFGIKSDEHVSLIRRSRVAVHHVKFHEAILEDTLTIGYIAYGFALSVPAIVHVPCRASKYASSGDLAVSAARTAISPAPQRSTMQASRTPRSQNPISVTTRNLLPVTLCVQRVEPPIGRVELTIRVLRLVLRENDHIPVRLI